VEKVVNKSGGHTLSSGTESTKTERLLPNLHKVEIAKRRMNLLPSDAIFRKRT
jgi:hypothetical protein